MTLQLNHTIVPSRDKAASAEFLAGILGVSVGRPWGPFLPVRIGPTTLDFMDADAFEEHHYAFLVDETSFDAMFERIRISGARWYADPWRQKPNEINHLYGGRGVYFDDPDRHAMELITQPYGVTPQSVA
jgi:catechol 2,3-dioxygenase-like lactoylglutathione lyase family enzyme